MRPISRRRILIGGTGFLAAPLWAGAGLAAEPDVVVIGAGAAGLAAAGTLLDAGYGVTVIEADRRTGGRAFTDTSIFGVPYDLGAHWLHNAEINPFVDYGRENGYSLYPAPSVQALLVGARRATQAESQAFDGAYDRAIESISRAGRSGRDVSPADVVPDGGEWGRTVHFAIGAYEMGKDFDRFSCLDWWNGEAGSDWFCKQGYGALWAHGSRGVPVQLSTKAAAVKWGGPGVTVETDRGSLAAKACIVTVSTGVLANEVIRFDPPLPTAKQESFHRITMGLYNHIALQFHENIFGTGDDGALLYRIESESAGSPRGMGLLTNVSGSNLTLCDVGGGFAVELEQEGREAAIDFALSELRRIFGGTVDKSLIKGHATSWGGNPFTFGSYASAEPGAHGLREALRAPVGERIWFAGEACSEDEWATLAGAHKSGIETAQAVMKVAGG